MADKRLLFVHGTGVRRAGREQTVARIRSGLATAGMTGIQVDFVDWGETHGTKVSDGDLRTVLPLGGAMALSGATEAEIEGARWSELLADPLVELRMAALRQTGTPTTAVPLPGGALPPDVVLVQAIHDLGSKLADPLSRRSLASGHSRGRPRAGKRAACSRGRAFGGIRPGRRPRRGDRACIVATTLRRARSEPGTGPSALFLRAERASLVGLVRSSLAPQTLGIGGWLRDKVRDVATAKASNWAIDRRDSLMRSSSPAAGDILFYQRRGEDILGMIEAKILELSEGVIR